VHLGTRGCKAEFLLDFLKHVKCETLYLVGDIIDLWKLKNGWYWPPIHSEIVRVIMEKAKKGTQVIYVPGNHDEFLRDYIDSNFAGIEVRERAVHETNDGRKFLVLHGDEFDYVVCTSKWLAVLGSEAYDFSLFLNRWFNYFRRKLGFPYWSLSAYLKHKVKNAVNFISNFEKILVHAAQENKVDGVICGHIHHAAIHEMDGLLYCNCGDWVESCTALIENETGHLAILHWADESAFLLTESELEVGTGKRRLAAAN
jgi:UDP-2,3-diacylglucosamine pyrophosphatase LpxH